MADLEKMSQKIKEFKQREQDILECALDLFLSQGEDKVTVEMIADKVGIGKGTDDSLSLPRGEGVKEGVVAKFDVDQILKVPSPVASLLLVGVDSDCGAGGKLRSQVVT